MSSIPAVSIVVPLLNEAGNIERLVEGVERVLDARGEPYEIVLVDDGSTDDSLPILARVEAASTHVRVFELVRNFGQAPALACGLIESRGAVVVTMDGDLQNPPEEIPRLLDAIEAGAFVVTGCRGVRHEHTWRWLGSRLVHWTARLLTGVDIHDFGGQFKAYRREVITHTLEVWAPGKPFFPLALWLGFPVAEVVVRHDPRAVGASRYTFASLVRTNLDLITSFTTIPLIALGGVGALLAAAGLAGLFARAADMGVSRFAAMASLAALSTGAVIAAVGIVGVYLARIYRHVAGGGTGYVIRRRPMADTSALTPVPAPRLAGDGR